MKAIQAVLVAAAVAVFVAPARAQEPAPAVFRVGAARVDISPSKLVDLDTQKVCLGGFGIGCSRRAVGETEPLYARAIVVADRDGVNRVVMATSSNIGLFAKYPPDFGEVGAWDVRKAASEATGIPIRSIVVTSDHSHSSPDVNGIWGGVDREYMERHAGALIQAIVLANTNLEPAHLRVGSTVLPDTWSATGQDPMKNHWDDTGTVLDQMDRELRVLDAVRPDDGSVIASIVNYSNHASIFDTGPCPPPLEGDCASGDWTGVLANRLSTEGALTSAGGNTIAMGMVGALGGIGARADDSQFYPYVDFLENLVAGARANGSIGTTAGVEARSTFIREMVTAPLLYLALVPVDAQHPANPIESSIDRSTLPPWLTGNVVGSHVSVLRLGDVLVGATPGEAYPEISFRFSGHSSEAREHLLFGLANDQLGYLISPLEGVPQTAENGALYPLAGNDNFALSASPTIGDHVACSLDDLARALEIGFGTISEDERCGVLTATDGLVDPESHPEVSFP